MAYIGREPSFGAFERQTITPDGSTTTFTLNYTVGSSSSILVSVAGVVQDPTGAYSISNGGTQIVFSAAPASGDTVFIIFLGIALDSSGLLSTSSITSQTDLGAAPATGDSFLIHDTSASALKEMTVANLFNAPALTNATGSLASPTITSPTIATSLDMNGTELILDADADTSITADTDDQIHIKIANTDHLQISGSSGDTVLKPMVDAKDITIQQFDGTELVNFNDAGYSSFTSAALNPEATLTDSTTVSWNALTQTVAKLTLGGSRTLSAPTGGAAGQYISLLAIQDSTGSRTITWNAVYEFKDDTAPTLTTTSNKGDIFTFRYNGSKWLEVGRNLNLTLS